MFNIDLSYRASDAPAKC